MQIQIIAVKVSTLKGKKEGTTYQVAEVTYKNLTFQNKVEGKKIMSFGAQESTFKQMALAQQDDTFDIEVVKNAAGYNDWVSAKKSDGSAPTAGPATAKQTYAASGAVASPKSTYETPEERAKKQVYIVRQSSISNAIDLLTTGAKVAPTVEDVLKTANQFESYVFGAATTLPAAETTSAFDNLEDDVPM